MSRRSSFLSIMALFALLTLPACRGTETPDTAHAPHEGAEAAEPEPWSVTAWSEHYELFAETEPLVAGQKALSHAHFTYMPDFSALSEGSVTGVLRGEDGREESFEAPKASRPGIFNVVFTPAQTGTYDLIYRVRNNKATEEVAAGQVKVGTAAEPGGLFEAPSEPAGAAPTGEPISFLKEQQWRTEFATDVAREGKLQKSLRATGSVLPASGGEITLTAPADGIVGAARWPHLGMEVARGAALFVLSPRIAADRSRAELEADVVELEAELGTAKARLERLRGLLAVEAASRRDVEEAEAKVKALSARREAARREQGATAAARGVGGGGGAGAAGGGPESFRISTPIAGRVAEVAVSPGQFVAAGTALGRIVRDSPVWLSLALLPEQAATLGEAPAGLTVRRWEGEDPLVIAGQDFRLVSRAPELDTKTGTVAVILEVRRGVELLRLGSRVEAEILLADELSGIVIPASTLVDDSGTEVVYVQLSGEAFERREVRVEARQGALALVRGLVVGERLATRGGNAIRRSSLLGSGAVEGHVH